jgi:hypothetical protein
VYKAVFLIGEKNMSKTETAYEKYIRLRNSDCYLAAQMVIEYGVHCGSIDQIVQYLLKESGEKHKGTLRYSVDNAVSRMKNETHSVSCSERYRF